MVWIWVVLAVLVLLWLVLRMRSGGGKGIENITPGEVESRLKSEPQKLHIIDVREPYEYSSGHISRAVNIPLGSIRNRFDEVPKDRDIVFVCRSGNRSMQAARLAKSAGLAPIYNMKGGMMSWSGAVKKKRK